VNELQSIHTSGQASFAAESSSAAIDVAEIIPQQKKLPPEPLADRKRQRFALPTTGDCCL